MTAKATVVTARLDALRARHSSVVDQLARVLAPSPITAAVDGTTLQRLLDDQVEALDEAHANLAVLADEVRRTVALQTNRPIDWDDERAQLGALLAEDPYRGTVSWFRQAIVAAVLFDLPGLTELLDGRLRLPDDAAVLVDRIRLLRKGLQDRDLSGCQELLTQAACGRLGERLDLSDVERAELALSLARLTLLAGENAEAERWVRHAAELGASDTDTHLVTAWLRRAGGDQAGASASLEAATAGDATPVELLVEFAHQLAAFSTDSPSAHLPIVEAEVWALTSIDTVEAEIDRLIEPAPPTVWLSLGRRLAAAGETERARTAIGRARGAVPPPPPELLAEIGECEVDIVKHVDGTKQPVSEVKDALVRAAVDRISADHLDRAVELLDEGLGLVPSDPEATLLRADCLRLKVSDMPLAESEPVLKTVLATAAAIPIVDGDADYSWGLLIRASAETMLSDGLHLDTWAHAWRSVEDAAWAVACRPSDATRWAQLTQAALVLGLQQVALRASAIGRQLAKSGDEQSFLHRAHAEALLNVGQLGEAAALAAGAGDPVLAVIIDAVEGELEPAIDELLPRGRAGSLASFEWLLLLLSMLASGDGRVPAFAERALADARQHPDQLSWVGISVLAELALGHPGRACELTPAIHEALQKRSSTVPYGAMWHGVALLLNGDTEGGGDVLRHALGLLTSTADGAVWHTIERSAIERLAAINRRPIPPELINEIDRTVDGRTATLAARGVDAELDLFELDGPDPAEALRITALVRAVMALLDNDSEPIVEQARLVWPDNGDPRAAFVAAKVREGTTKLRAALLASKLPQMDAAEQQRTVETILRLDSFDADVYFRNASFPAPVRLDVGRVLTELASASELGTPASRVLRYLQWPEATEPLDKADSVWQLQLPSSWFDGFDDVLRKHPLFTDTIPTFRRARELPGINVTANGDFEPDSYAIFHEDKLLERGRAPRAQRWLPTNDRTITPGWIPRGPASETSPWVAVEPPADDDPIGYWCTADTYEMLVRRVSAFAATPTAAVEAESATTFGDVVSAAFKWLVGRRQRR